ncbi:sulfotransferase domain-containing protein [Halioxenophilus aromaticivorans]|uniref:Sulfotransferase domain-containing protein n=1 Tax=Halioxenophilus aromaticivorans TaxID=1306992 RepID=A0AAV3TZJ0_9ALTE
MRRHLILTHGRSGSNFLTNSLNLHPQIVNYGEVLGDWTLPSKLRRVGLLENQSLPSYLDQLYNSKALFYCAQAWSAKQHLIKHKPVNLKRHSAVKSLGIKEFGIHFQRNGLADYLQDHHDIDVIYLYRENILDRYISVQSLQRNRVVLSESSTTRLAKMTIDIDDMMQSLDVLRGELDYTHQLIASLAPNRVLTIRYEDAFKDGICLQAMCNQVFQFLGVETIAEKSQQKKILSRSLEQVIDNFDDFQSAIHRSQYSNLLAV